MLSRDTGVSPEVYSVSSRLLLSLLLHLSRFPPSLISRDLTFHGEFSTKLQNACIELASVKSAALGRTLPLLINLSDQSVRCSAHLVCGRSDGAFSRSMEVLAIWIFCCTRGYPHWYDLYHLWRTLRCFGLRRASWNENCGLRLGWRRLTILNLPYYPLIYRHRCRQRYPKILPKWWKQPLLFLIPLPPSPNPRTPSHQTIWR